jgi:hypothetical protein
MKIGFSTYLALGKLERYNKVDNNLYRIIEVIRQAHLLKEKGKYFHKNRSILFPTHNRKRWKLDPMKPIRITAIINSTDYAIIQEILIEKTGKAWAFDKFIKLLLVEFINNEGRVLEQEDNYYLRRFHKRFKKYFNNIMEEWK